MNRLTIIGWYIIGFGISIILLLCFIGCCQKTYESVVRDTVTTVRVDSVIVNMRDVEVAVPVPQITFEQWSPIDTISVLDNGLYISTVEVVGGMIHHTLSPLDGTLIHTTVTVTDTTHITTTTTNSRHHAKEVVTVKEEETLWGKVRKGVGDWTMGIVSLLIIIVVIYFFVTKRN